MPLDGDSMGALARLRERAEREESGAPDRFAFPVFERGKIDPMRLSEAGAQDGAL